MVKSPMKSFEIHTQNGQEKQNWMLLLEAAISRLKPKSNALSPNANANGHHHTKLQSHSSMTMSATNSIVDDDGVYAPHWVPYEASDRCLCCKLRFTAFNRKHHCRRCGHLVCSSCSEHRVFLKEKSKAVRICDERHCREQGDDDGNGNGNEDGNGVIMNGQSGGGPQGLSKEIFDFLGEYKEALSVLMEYLVHRIMDIVENNKVIAECMASHRFWARNIADEPILDRSSSSKLEQLSSSYLSDL